MADYDVAIIGSGLGGLTAAAILARAGRKVIVIEKSNSVGGAASSYKVGDLFVEGSLHETSDPHDPRDPKHDPLTRAGVLDAVKWIPVPSFYEVRGGPMSAPLIIPDNFADAQRVLSDRFPDARKGIESLLHDMQQMASAVAVLSRGVNAFKNPLSGLQAFLKFLPAFRDWHLTLSQKLDSTFGNNEAVKAAIAANLSYYHDDPKTLWWIFFAMAQGGYLQSGGRFVQGGSQRLSSALARVVIKSPGCSVVLRRIVSAIEVDSNGRVSGLTHTAKNCGDLQAVKAKRVVGNAAPETLATLLPGDTAKKYLASFAGRGHSISLFALTLGLSKPPGAFGIVSYSTQLLPEWMKAFDDYAKGTALMAHEPGTRMPPLAIVNYATIESGVPSPPHVLSIVGPDLLSNWNEDDQEAYRAKRARWQDAIVTYLDANYPGLAAAVVASSFNTALSVKQYLGAPHGAVYGFAPTPPRSLFSTPKRTPATNVPGLYLASAYAGFGGYTGAIQAGSSCADIILRDV